MALFGTVDPRLDPRSGAPGDKASPGSQRPTDPGRFVQTRENRMLRESWIPLSLLVVLIGITAGEIVIALVGSGVFVAGWLARLWGRLALTRLDVAQELSPGPRLRRGVDPLPDAHLQSQAVAAALAVAADRGAGSAGPAGPQPGADRHAQDGPPGPPDGAALVRAADLGIHDPAEPSRLLRLRADGAARGGTCSASSRGSASCRRR